MRVKLEDREQQQTIDLIGLKIINKWQSEGTMCKHYNIHRTHDGQFMTPLHQCETRVSLGYGCVKMHSFP